MEKVGAMGVPLARTLDKMPGCRRCCDPVRIASSSTVTSPTSRRMFMLTATICRPSSGLILSNWRATLDFAPTNCARYNRW